jgi:hypothetical protein
MSIRTPRYLLTGGIPGASCEHPFTDAKQPPGARRLRERYRAAIDDLEGDSRA